MALRVPLRQPLWPPCRCSAAYALRILLRMAASAIEGLCQASMARGSRYAYLGSAERLICLVGHKKGTRFSQLVFLLHCLWFFVAPSAVAFVNIEKGSAVVNKHCSCQLPLLGLRGAQKPLRRPGSPQVAVALASRIKSTIVFRYPQTC